MITVFNKISIMMRKTTTLTIIVVIKMIQFLWDDGDNGDVIGDVQWYK